MNRRFRWGCASLVLLLVLAAVPVAFADDDAKCTGPYTLEGSWWRSYILGGAAAYKATINRIDAKRYTVEFSGFAVEPGFDGLPPTTQVTSSPAVVERVGKYSYQFTWVLWYGDGQYDAPYRGTPYAAICFGPLVQDGPDHFYMDNTCFASLNPCLFGPNSQRCEDLGDGLWDPFTDPDRIPAPPPPVRIEYQRIPLLYELPPQE